MAGSLGPLVRLKPRRSGEERIVTLHPELGIVVRFTVPFPVQELEIEAAANASRAVLIKSPVVAARYGLAQAVLSKEQAGETTLRVNLTEAAIVLWKEWTVMAESGDAAAELSVENISQLLTDPVCHRLWADHYFAACSLERDEGNGSAVSPSTSSGEAATTAEGAPSSTSPAAEASPPTAAGSARRPRTSRRRPKASSSEGSPPLPAS